MKTPIKIKLHPAIVPRDKRAFFDQTILFDRVIKSSCIFAKIENSNFLKQLAKNCNHPLGRTIIAGNDHTGHAVDIMLKALRRQCVW